MKLTLRGYGGLAAGLCAALLSGGCDRSPSAQPSPQRDHWTSIATTQEEPLPLLVPYRGLMVGMIDWSAYGIFSLSTSDAAMDEDAWTAAGMAAVNIIAATSLLSMQSANADDKRRASDTTWRGMVTDMQNASLLIAMSVQQRDRAEFTRTANLLANTCQTCHDKFRVLPRPDTSQFAER